jgi:hypothetical protein
MKQPNGHSTITVAKVWQPYNPGDKKGKVVDTQGIKWSVFADKLDLYQEGGTYDIEYDHWLSPRDGKVYHTIVDSAPSDGATPVNANPAPVNARAAPVNTPAPRPNGHIAPRQRTDPTDAERMFVCSILNAFVSANKVEPDLTTLVGDVQMLRDVWRNTFGADA